MKNETHPFTINSFPLFFLITDIYFHFSSQKTFIIVKKYLELCANRGLKMQSKILG